MIRDSTVVTRILHTVLAHPLDCCTNGLDDGTMKEPPSLPATKPRQRRRGSACKWLLTLFMIGIFVRRIVIESEGIGRRENNRGLIVVHDKAVREPPPLLIPANYSVNDEGRLVISWTGPDAMEALVDTIWERNYFCDAIKASRRNWTAPLQAENVTAEKTLPITLKLSFGCRDLYTNGKTGSGNYLQALYMMRLAATVLEHVDVRVACHDAEAAKRDLILPWFTGRWHWIRRSKERLLRVAESVKKNRRIVRYEACRPFWDAPIGLMHQDIQYDLRRMAVSLLGAIPDHPSAVFAEKFLRNSSLRSLQRFEPQLAHPLEDAPLFRNVTLDDAVIHFRCGDLLTTNLTSYGFMKFSGYTRHISAEARSIGILTQPFQDKNNQQQRTQDADFTSRRRCRTLVVALKAYILRRNPTARVFIRNDPDETIALTYARMVMANQTVGTMSTFSAFPVVATFGTGYFLRPKKWSPNVWMRNHPNMIDELTGKPNLVLFDEESVLVGSQAADLWNAQGVNAVLGWFRS
jgi:hypothetical protein